MNGPYRTHPLYIIPKKHLKAQVDTMCSVGCVYEMVDGDLYVYSSPTPNLVLTNGDQVPFRLNDFHVPYVPTPEEIVRGLKCPANHDHSEEEY